MLLFGFALSSGGPSSLFGRTDLDYPRLILLWILFSPDPVVDLIPGFPGICSLMWVELMFLGSKFF